MTFFYFFFFSLSKIERIPYEADVSISYARRKLINSSLARKDLCEDSKNISSSNSSSTERSIIDTIILSDDESTDTGSLRRVQHNFSSNMNYFAHDSSSLYVRCNESEVSSSLPLIGSAPISCVSEDNVSSSFSCNDEMSNANFKMNNDVASESDYINSSTLANCRHNSGDTHYPIVLASSNGSSSFPPSASYHTNNVVFLNYFNT